MARRALLLGIDAYEDASLHLSAPANDVAELSKVLGLIGFTIDPTQKLIGSSGKALSTNTLRHEIRRFLNNASRDDELWIYFSGHGVEWEGDRLLIPQDYYPGDPRPHAELVSDQNLYAWARTSPAASVIIIIDACREGIQLQIAPDPSVSKRIPDSQSTESSPEPTNDVPTIAILYSCGQGEFSYSLGGDTGYSYFTKALGTVLAAEDDKAALAEIIEATQQELNEILPDTKQQTVTLDERRIAGRAGLPGQLIIKEDQVAQLRRKIEASQWCKDARSSDLWKDISEASSGLADQVQAIIYGAEEFFLKASTQLPQQRWRHSAMPVRVVYRLTQLIQGREKLKLTEPEAAVALVVPHVYEAVLAAAESRLTAEGKPLDPLADEEKADASRMWRALRNSFLTQEAWTRRKSLLVRRGFTEAADDVAAWQLTQFLHESGELWDYTPGAFAKGWVDADLDDVFGIAPFPDIREDRRVRTVLEGKRLIRLARLMFASFDDIELERAGEYGQRLNAEFRVGEVPNEWHLDEVKLAHLLALASAMAPDSRRLSSVFVEHLGIVREGRGEESNSTPEVTVESLQEVLSWAEWRTDSEGLALGLECPHEAMDAALEELIQSIDQHRRQLALAELGPSDCLNALPKFFTNREVQIVEDQGRPRFKRPHLRFGLDQNRVRDLLMGQALYGEPELALRELYQNALDACRYRRTRECYLWKIRDFPEEEPPYIGRITFRAGVENGRPFIECADNGIGMAERHIRKLFAKAGQRFTDSHEFHLEKANWEAAGIPFYPNSRFGIGVFSYFMLADEILIETRRLKLDGMQRDLGVRARIVGSGSLFRLQIGDEIRPQGGTLVRLYLNTDKQLKENPLRTIEEWLWLPEFETIWETQDGSKTTLHAGELSPKLLQEMGPAIPIPESVGEAGQPRAYWALRDLLEPKEEFSRNDREGKGKGALLVDGIKTAIDKQEREEDKLSSVQPILSARKENITNGPRGLVVNLCEDLQPELSVDRNRITSWKAGQSWLRSLLVEKAFHSILEYPKISFTSLSALSSIYPALIMGLDQGLRNSQLSSKPLRFTPDSSQVLQPKSVGICEVDQYIFSALPVDNRSSDRKIIMEHARGSRLLRARLSWLYKARLELPKPFARLARFDANVDMPNPRLGTGQLLVSNRRTTGRESLWRTELDLGHLLEAAAKWDVSLGEVLDLVRPLGEIAITLPQLDKLPRAFRLNERQWSLLSKESKGGESSWRTELERERLLEAAAKWDVSLGEVLDLVRPLGEVGITLPQLDKLPRAFRFHERQRQMLSRESRGRESLWRTGLGLEHLLEAAAKWNVSLGEVLDLVRPLGEVGIPLPPLDKLPREFCLSECQKQILQEEDLTDEPSWRTELEPVHLLEAAAKWNISLGEVLDLVRPLGEVGIPLPPLDKLPREFRLSERQKQLLSGELAENVLGMMELPSWRTELEWGHFTGAAALWGISLGEFFDLIRPLEEVGITIPSSSNLTREFRLSERQKKFLYGNLSTTRDITGSVRGRGRFPPSYLNVEVKLAHIFRVAVQWEVSLGEALEEVQLLKEVGVSLPSLDKPMRGFRPTERQWQLLAREYSGKSGLKADGWQYTHIRWYPQLELGYLLEAAAKWNASLGEVIAEARPLEEIGIALPSLDKFPQELRVKEHQRRLLFKDIERSGYASSEIVFSLSLDLFLQASEEWGMSLREIIDLALPLIEVGIKSDSDLAKLRAALSDNQFDSLLQWVEKDEDRDLYRLDPWFFVICAHRHSEPVAKYIDALEQMADLSIEVEECLDFARFCRDMDKQSDEFLYDSET